MFRTFLFSKAKIKLNSSIYGFNNSTKNHVTIGACLNKTTTTTKRGNVSSNANTQNYCSHWCQLF